MDAPSIQQPEVGTTFRAAMRRLASTVTIVTSADGARHHGMTMTAVSSLSMDPPSMIVCVNQSTFLHDIMLSARRFCVNVLRHDHAAVSTAFSGASSPEERFQIGAWLQTEDGIDYLSDAQANIFCKKVAAVPFGTHTVFIGTAVDVALNDDAKPLLYRNAAYC
ncbi:flavin reductase (DIM6/NTAB) family NADH-FMN oxidoreductase RutF [Paraburkholderia bannensis]|uniref:Flavin reductase (DIM6/NTAB) family NADH-FMN oxidoreductase RutF n=1 Tax=Paraburkholderia bannensis TaxID=765414 RepID=A0A7W9U2U5_9BURK|nr:MULTISPECIES: flavin reductase family protein [Paraburkholderia]MBB3259860.1 flavin reductase (DIM6/NTAB) family NADH-FMN oxidoreductase RutF [Paraburkholderia sp. WP4_3_2]MBB6104830.1 flavin reductase (DIM6/NTAB) family NADH-FMN oxidoreductase RutF [Paraburkholderia bannensis]